MHLYLALGSLAMNATVCWAFPVQLGSLNRADFSTQLCWSLGGGGAGWTQGSLSAARAQEAAAELQRALGLWVMLNSEYIANPQECPKGHANGDVRKK